MPSASMIVEIKVQKIYKKERKEKEKYWARSLINRASGLAQELKEIKLFLLFLPSGADPTEC